MWHLKQVKICQPATIYIVCGRRAGEGGGERKRERERERGVTDFYITDLNISLTYVSAF